MKIKTTVINELSVNELAHSLACSSAEEFAKFWLEFAEFSNDETLDKFAQAMAPNFGGQRKQPLKKLCSLINFYEVKAGKDK